GDGRSLVSCGGKSSHLAMIEILKDLAKTGRTPLLATLIASAAMYFLVGQVAPQGEVAISTKTLSSIFAVAVTLAGGLISWGYQYWKRDRKREKIGFAREMGANICWCTPNGEIMILVDGKIPARKYQCPKCPNFQ